MKHLFILLISILLLFFPQLVYAEEALPGGRQGWVIERFESNIDIQKSGEVIIKEKLEVDFNTISKHGIYRDIPYVYERDGTKTYTEIDIERVLQNNKKAQVSESTTDGYVRLKIGDPDKTITGRNSYEITYTAKGVLRGFSDYDELYWNVTGNNWPVGIQNASATVSLPTEGVIKKTCFEGYVGSTGECMIISESPNEVKFKNLDALSEAQGLTVVVGYEKGLVPILTVERPKTFWEKLIDWPSLTTLGILALFGIGTAIYLWNKNGRDYWFGQGVFGKIDNLGSVKPHVAHETTVVEYTPPEKLTPAMLGVLVDERAHTHDVVATIIDLAGRGFMTIKEIDKKWLFGKIDYELNRSDKDAVNLLGYEKLLLEKLFDTEQSVKVSGLKNSFYADLKKVKDALYDEVVTRKLFPTNPEKVRSKYLAGGIIMLFVGIFLVGYTIGFDNVFLTDLCLGLIVSGAVTLGFSRYMPRRTAYGRDLYRRVKGYRLFIDKAETHRQKFFEKKNLFNEVLPYAIVLGLTGKFAKAMEEIGLKTTNTGWYSGTGHFNMGNLESSMSSFSNSMSSAIASTPSSSGGFSGGGSSGGGFGGGGGGSW